MKRIAVYGNASQEKEALVKNLNASDSKDYFFESSTPEDRFTQISVGLRPSVYTASWQLLLVNLSDERLLCMPKIDVVFPQSDFNRPLVIVFYGKERVLFEAYKKSLSQEKWVALFHVKHLNEVSNAIIIHAFSKLENIKHAKESATFSF